MAIRGINTAEVDPALLGGPSSKTPTEGASTTDQTQPAEAPKVDQKITLDDAYLAGFKGGYVGVARIAIHDSMLPGELRDLVSPNIVVTALPTGKPEPKPYSA